MQCFKQAAIGGLALDQAFVRKQHGEKNDDEIKYGEDVSSNRNSVFVCLLLLSLLLLLLLLHNL